MAAAPVLAVRPTNEIPPLALQLQKMGEEVGLSPLKISQTYVRLAMGPGRVSFQDFARLRLFDPAFHAGDVTAYVGARKNRDICVTANYRHDWLGLIADKIASASFLSAYGLPIIPTKTIFAPRLTGPRANVLCTERSLESFLLSSASYPLFGKPVDGFQSLGSVALTAVDPTRRQLLTPHGAPVALDAFMAEVVTHYSGGYIFQDLRKPHRAVAALCGERLACARIVTALFEDGPRILRTALKIPAGANSADNYWRHGNFLAQIDVATGRVRRVTSGTGLTMREHSHHPDTGAPLIGFDYPEWDALKSIALEGARLMQHVPLIGWDVAATEEGPVIVEMNATPDFFLVQFAERRGIIDEPFEAFMAYQAGQSSAHLKRMKAQLRRL